MPAAASLPTVEIGILGSVECRVDGVPVGLGRRLARSVLAMLALQVGRVVSVDTLIDVLYAASSATPSDPGNALQVQVSQLRKVLGAAGARDAIETHSTGYRLALAAECVDAIRFERLINGVLGDAERGATWTAAKKAHADITDALAMWRGVPVPELGQHVAAVGAVTRLEELYTAGREVLIELLLVLGRHHEAVAAANALLADDPYRERAHELRVVGLYRCGRQADALRSFQQARTVLVEELGVEPGPALQAIERAVLDQDATLDWVPPQGVQVAEVPIEVSVDELLAVRVEPVRLPIATSALIGREDEVSRLGELVRRHRLVTITGPGGAGKSRLGVEVAARFEPARYVDLDGVTVDGQVNVAIAGAFGVSSSDPARVLVGVERTDPEGVIVIDTCEHVVEGAAAAVRMLVDRCPRLRILAISRRPLEIRDEVVWPVPPLELPGPEVSSPEIIGRSAAVELFVARAAAVLPGFRLDVDSAQDVAAICRSLDGLPLALELAAARMDVLSPAQIRSRLDDRFRLLKSRTRDAHHRQRSLRATIDWSLEALEPASRRALDRLAVIPAPFGLDLALDCIGNDLADPLDSIEDLLRHSLVSRRGDGRFHVLDSVRLYVGERTDAGDRAEAAAAIVRWVDEWTSTLTPQGDRRDALMALRREGPIVRFAVDWALDAADTSLGLELCARLAWYWTVVGDEADGRRWMAAALDDPRLEPRHRVAILLAAGALDGSSGRFDRAWESVIDALIVAAELGFDALADYAHIHLGSTWWSVGTDADPRPADRTGARSDWWPIVLALLISARASIDRGDLAASADHQRVADLLLDSVHDDRLAAMRLEIEARMRAAAGDAGFRPVAERALRWCAELDHVVGQASVELFLAQQLVSSDTMAARRYAHAAADHYGRLGHHHLASAARELGDSARTADPQPPVPF